MYRRRNTMRVDAANQIVQCLVAKHGSTTGLVGRFHCAGSCADLFLWPHGWCFVLLPWCSGMGVLW